MVDRVSSQRPQVAAPTQAPRPAKVEAHEHVATPAAKAKAEPSSQVHISKPTATMGNHVNTAA
jgi:hypothetical protein